MEIAHMLAWHCAAEARDPASIEKTVVTGTDPLADVDGFLRTMAAYAALGVTKVWVSSAPPDLSGWVGALGDQVLPRLRDL